MDFMKGDIVLVSSPHSEHAGLTGIVKRMNKKSTKVIVKIFETKKSIWFDIVDLIKITKDQKSGIDAMGEKMPSVLSS